MPPGALGWPGPALIPEDRTTLALNPPFTIAAPARRKPRHLDMGR
jgi:hypothetical protein